MEANVIKELRLTRVGIPGREVQVRNDPGRGGRSPAWKMGDGLQEQTRPL